MTLSPDDPLLTVVNFEQDRARRRRLAGLVIGIAVIGMGWMTYDFRYPGFEFVVPAGVTLLAFVGVAVRFGLFVRVRALLRLRRLDARGADAGRALAELRLEDADRAYAKLVEDVRTLAIYHATFVGHYGILAHLKGESQLGLELVHRALDSRWLDGPRVVAVRAGIGAWAVYMWLHAGDTTRARAIASTLPFPIAMMSVVDAYDGKWPEVVAAARRALADATTPKERRPVLALLGSYAARQCDDPARAELEAAHAAEPLAPIALAIPALQRFLPRR